MHEKGRSVAPVAFCCTQIDKATAVIKTDWIRRLYEDEVDIEVDSIREAEVDRENMEQRMANIREVGSEAEVEEKSKISSLPEIEHINDVVDEKE